MKILLQKVEAFKKASNKKAVTKDSLVEKVANRIDKLAIVNSISQESGNTIKTLTGRYGSRALFTAEMPEGVSESEFRSALKESVLSSDSLRDQVWEMYQSFSQTNSLNAKANGGQA